MVLHTCGCSAYNRTKHTLERIFVNSPTSPPSPRQLDETFGIEPSVYHRRWKILAILCLSLVTIVIAVSSLNVAIPTIIGARSAGSTATLWIVEAYALVFAGFLLPAGALGDRYGRKHALVIGLIVFGAMSLVASRSTSPSQLIAARAVMGIGAALIMPATLSIITNIFPAHERQKAIATWAGLAGAGGALGPLMSGLVLKWFWWGSVFFVNIPLVLVLLTLVWYFVPNSKDPHGHDLDPVGALISIIMLGSLVFGIIEGPEWGWLSSGVMGSLLVAVLSGAAFVKWELATQHPMLDPRLFRLRGFAMGSLSVTSSFFCMFGMFFLASQYLQFVHGYSALETGVRTLPSAIMMVLVSPRSPAITAKIGVKNAVRIGYALIVCGFLGMSTLDTTSAYWHFAIFLVLIATGMAMQMAPASGMIVSSLPLAKAGVGSAVNDVTREIGGALGIAIMGSVLSSGYRSAMTDATASFPIPGTVRPLVEDSIGKAFGVAERAATQIGPQAVDSLRRAARASFVSGSHFSFLVAVGVAALAGLVVSTFIPNAHEHVVSEVHGDPGE